MQLYTNNAVTTLATTIIASDTTIVLATGDGALFPSPTGSNYFLITLDDGLGTVEIVKVTTRTGDNLTGCTRGQEGTTAVGWAAGTVIQERVTAAALGRYEQAVVDAAAANATAQGWVTEAYSLGQLPTSTATTNGATLDAAGGTVVFQVHVPAKLLLDSITVQNRNTSLARSFEIRLYQQLTNTGAGAENTLAHVAGSNGSISFTPTVASNRTITVSGSPLLLLPGQYWLAVRNTHATNTLILGVVATTGGTFLGNRAQIKTLGSALGSTLDFVAATWTKSTALYGCRLAGIVFGQASAF